MSLRIQSTAKPKSNWSASIVCDRLSIIQDCAAPLEMTPSTFSGSRPRSAAKFSALGERLRQSGQADLIDHLRKLTGPHRADQRDRLGVCPHHVLDAREVGGIAADHDRQLAILRPGLPAGHRRIEEAHALVVREVGDGARHLRRSRRMVDEYRPLPHPGKGAKFAQGDAAKIIVVADAGEHELGLARQPRRAYPPVGRRIVVPRPGLCPAFDYRR